MSSKTLNRPAKSPTNGVHCSNEGVDGHVRIPTWVVDHSTFRVWACSPDGPKRGRVAFLTGSIWVDLSMETAIHNRIKTIVAMILSGITLDENLGEYFSDGMLISNTSVKLSTDPDGCFVSRKSVEHGLAALKNGDQSLELEGTPDMVLEVISKTTLTKDTVLLKGLYAAAGVAEYWLVDSTSETPTLEIHRLSAGKYVATRNHDGWVKSRVFGRSFRLQGTPGFGGLTQFALETK